MIEIYIYKITNDINDKVYIGQTIRPVEDRFKRHVLDAVNNKLDTHFARAIRKYGPEHFHYEIIDNANSQEELNLKEQYWIRYYDSTHKGYNETDALCKCGGNTYQSKSAEELQDIGEKISQTKLGKSNPHARAIKCYNVDTNKEIFFDTVKECRDYFQQPQHRFITTRVTGQVKSLYMNKWKIAYADQDYGNFHRGVYREHPIMMVIDMETQETQQFGSMRHAAQVLNINESILENRRRKGLNPFCIDQYEFTMLN